MRSNKERIKRIYPDCEIYLFGSVAEGNYDILSDIDVAIVTNSKEDKRIEIQKILGMPFEIHLFSKKEWEEIRNKIGKYIKI